MELQVHLHFGPQLENSDYWLDFLSLWEFAFSQGFFILSDNFVTSEKFLGSGMKWENSEPDSPKGVNSCEIYVITVLNTLCKPFPMLRVAFNAFSFPVVFA